MKYNNNVQFAKAKFGKTFEHLVQFQELVSGAIGDKHSDNDLEYRGRLEDAAHLQLDDQRISEEASEMEEKFQTIFPEIALRGVFLVAISEVENMLHVLALRFFHRTKSQDDKKPNSPEAYRKELLENWKSKKTAEQLKKEKELDEEQLDLELKKVEEWDRLRQSKELSDWNELQRYFKVRNAILHPKKRKVPDPKKPGKPKDDVTTQAVLEIRCPKCKESKTPAKDCNHLVKIHHDGLLSLGHELPIEFIRVGRRYVNLHLDNLP